MCHPAVGPTVSFDLFSRVEILFGFIFQEESHQLPRSELWAPLHTCEAQQGGVFLKRTKILIGAVILTRARAGGEGEVIQCNIGAEMLVMCWSEAPKGCGPPLARALSLHWPGLFPSLSLGFLVNSAALCN